MRFVNPNVLYFLLAALVPVIVHLFKWQRYKRIYFSNVRLLEEIQMRQKRNARLREYLVLACRILTIVCIVLAFARPYLPQKDTHLAASGQTHVSIYMDNSFSMQAPTSRTTLLEKAKEQVRRILQAFPPDASVQLLTNDFRGEDQVFLSPGLIEERLQQVDFSSVPRNLSEVLLRQEQLFEQAGVAPVSRLYYCVSDFQKLNFDCTGLKDSSSRYVFVPVRGTAYSNISLDSLCLDFPVLQAGRQTFLRAFLQNRSDKEQLQLLLRLFVEERQVGAYPVDLKPGEKKQVQLPLYIEKSGNLQGYVEIADYPVEFDNRLYFSLQIAPKIKVLHLFDKDFSASVSKVFAGDSTFDYRRLPVQNIDYGILKTAALVVADALAEWPSALVGELAQFVLEGGSLFLIPGVPLDDESGYVPNELICHRLTGRHCGPLVREDVAVKGIDTDHPVFSLAFSSVQKDAAYPRTKAHYPLPSDADVPFSSLMYFRTENTAEDADFLQVYRSGKGFLYLLASPLGKEFGDFQEHYTFVVALLNMALYRGASTELYRNTAQREAIYFPSALFCGHTDEDDVFHISAVGAEDFDLIPSVRRTGSETAFFLHESLTEAGNYRLSGAQMEDIPLSFNYSRRESDKDCMDEASLMHWMQTYSFKNVFLMNPDKTDLSTSVERMNRGRELWKVFLIFALAFALFETLLLRGIQGWGRFSKRAKKSN